MDVRIDGESEGSQTRQRIPLRFWRRSISLVNRKLIGEKREPALRRERRIELAHAARRSVARIRKRRQALAFALAIEPLESLWRR